MARRDSSGHLKLGTNHEAYRKLSLEADWASYTIAKARYANASEGESWALDPRDKSHMQNEARVKLSTNDRNRTMGSLDVQLFKFSRSSGLVPNVKRQHYVPRALFKQFEDARGTLGIYERGKALARRSRHGGHK